MKTFCSHTLVKNGQPFIGLILRQVIPYANRCLVTISKKSNDGTLETLKELMKEFPGKLSIDFEDVKKPSNLTFERQKQVARTTEDWILFLDSDDYWMRDSIVEIMKKLDEDVDAFAVTPYQLIDQFNHDHGWRYKHFSKWLKNQPGLHYRGLWPKDLIYLNDDILFARKNKRVKCLGRKYIHLSHIMPGSFRKEKWAERYKQTVGTPVKIPDRFKKEMERIYAAKS